MAPRKNQPRNDRQDKILEFIRSEVERRGFPPSVREICDAMGIKSTSTVHGHLRRLENRGLLVRDPTKPRAIEVVGMQHRTAQIPLVGKAPAGVPITAVETSRKRSPSRPASSARTRTPALPCASAATA